ncbi:site-specific integrase [Paenibacillus sp. FSL R7-0189]|uniref:tyrosine-type recombinase/integrase n=1 Tax=Paenibacillus sp. FSL R7-0189 TaxID=2921673 RepID=UPI0030DBEDEB
MFDHSNDNQNKYPIAPATQHFPNFFWNEYAKEVSWNSASTKIFSEESLNPRNQVHTVTMQFDVKKITKAGVINMLDALYTNGNPLINSVSYLGPNQINFWIFENRIKSNFQSEKITEYFGSLQSSKTPFEFYRTYKCFNNFLECFSVTFNIPVSKIDDTELLNQERFLKVIQSEKLGDPDVKYLSKLVNLYHPGLDIVFFKKRRNTPHNWDLEHPLIELHLGNFKGLKKASLQFRKRAFYQFLTWLCDTYTAFNSFNLNDVPLWLVTHDHLTDFRLHLVRKIEDAEMEPSYTSSILNYVKSLFQSLFQLGRLLTDITDDIPSISYERYHYREIPSDEQIEHLFKVIQIYSPDPDKYTLAFEMMLYLGLRKTEVSQIRWENINLHTNIITITGKGDRTHSLPIPTKILQSLNKLSALPSGYIFSPMPDKIAQSLYQYVKMFSLIAGWNIQTGLHLLRHTMLTKLSYRPDCPPQVLRVLGRQKNAATSALYVHRSQEELRKSANKINILF